MASHDWRSSRPLGRQIVEDFSDFDYYQLVRLGRWLVSHCHGKKDGPAEGAAQDLAEPINPDDSVRVRADLSPAFNGYELSSLRLRDGGRGLDLTSPNYCVASNAAPLPLPFVEWLRELAHDGKRAGLDFLDIFNQRLHLWRWRIKSQLHPGLHSGKPEHSDYADYLGAVSGLSAIQESDDLPGKGLPRRALLGLAGLLADGRRGIPVIERVVSTLLGSKVQVEPMVGRWLPIDDRQRMRLGGLNSQLHINSIIGRRWYDHQAAIRLRSAPMSREQICRFIPGGDQHDLLKEMLHLVTERRVDVFVELRLDAEGLPGAALQPGQVQGQSENDKPKGCGSKLRYTAVLGAARPETDSDTCHKRPDSVNFLLPAFDEPEPEPESAWIEEWLVARQGQSS